MVGIHIWAPNPAASACWYPVDSPCTVLKSDDAKAALNEPCGEEGYWEVGVNAEPSLKESLVTPPHTTLTEEAAEDVIRTIVYREVVSDPKNDR